MTPGERDIALVQHWLQKMTRDPEFAGCTDPREPQWDQVRITAAIIRYVIRQEREACAMMASAMAINGPAQRLYNGSADWRGTLLELAAAIRQRRAQAPDVPVEVIAPVIS